MSFGNNHPERSRKRHLIQGVQINMLCRMAMDEVQKVTRGWMRKTLVELETLSRAEFTSYPLESSTELPDF